MEQFISQLEQALRLTDEQVRQAVARLVDEQVPVESKTAFLLALARKGETVEEIFAFARELRDLAVQVPLHPESRKSVILDVCGTGGDRLNTFNISTAVAFVVASAGVAVAKHGNRAITSQTGSADLLEALGLRIDLSPEDAALSLREHHFCFLFAPYYHPAFKHIAPARKLCAQQGQRTIFNFLGPLLNPARPSAQLVGVPQPALCEPLARVLQSLGVRRGMVVSGSVGSCSEARGAAALGKAPTDAAGAFLDELSIFGPTIIAEFYQPHALNRSVVSLDGLPIGGGGGRVEDLRGGDRDINAELVRRILGSQEHGPKREAVLLNAGAALLVAGKTRSLTEGWNVAAELIDSGAATKKLNDLIRASKGASGAS